MAEAALTEWIQTATQSQIGAGDAATYAKLFIGAGLDSVERLAGASEDFEEKIGGNIESIIHRRVLKKAIGALVIHVVFTMTQHAGHINPTLPLVAALKRRNANVTYFAQGERDGLNPADVVQAGSPLGQAVIATGATLLNYRVAPALVEEPLLKGQKRWHKLPTLLEDLKALQPPPSIILFDPFDPTPAVCAKLMGVPACCLVPHSGPGVFGISETDEAQEEVADIRIWLQREYKLDLADFGLAPMSWYSPWFNLVMTSEEVFAPMNTDAQRARWSGPNCWHCVGTMNEVARNFQLEDDSFPLEELRALTTAGKKIVFMSLGSMVTGTFLDKKIAGLTENIADNVDPDNTAFEGKTFGEMTGKEFFHFVLRQTAAAVGGHEDVVVVVGCGRNGPEEVLKGYPAEIPSNFRMFAFVPQMALLPLCSAFITHAGNGSIMESVILRVPVIGVPVFGDQLNNADQVSAAKLGVGFMFPVKTFQEDAVRKAVLGICGLGPDGNASTAAEYKRAVEASASKMERTGGPEKAVDLLIQAAEGKL